MNIVKYTHHNVEVNVFEELKGKHREHCLCHQECRFFKPNPPNYNNCIIAQRNYELCVKYNITTPVYECPKYERKIIKNMQIKIIGKGTGNENELPLDDLLTRITEVLWEYGYTEMEFELDDGNV